MRKMIKLNKNEYLDFNIFQKVETGPLNWIKKAFNLDNLPSVSEIGKRVAEKLTDFRNVSGLNKIKPFPDEKTDIEARLKQVKEDLQKGKSDLKAEKKEIENKLITEEGVMADLVEMVKDYPGIKFIGKIPGNGGREVVIYVPQGFDPDKPVELAYHFHGKNAQFAGKNKETSGGRRLKDALDAVQKGQMEGKNTIVVYPLSAGSRGSSYDTEWMKKGNNSADDMALLDENVRKILANQMNLPNLNIKETRISGHSAGGAALKNILQDGFRVDRAVFLDASYAGWATEAYSAAIKNNPQIQFDVIAIPNTETSLNAESLRGKPGVEIVSAEGGHGDMNKNYFNWERAA